MPSQPCVELSWVWQQSRYNCILGYLKIFTFQMKATREAADHPLRLRGDVLTDKLAVVKAQVVSTRNMVDRSMLASRQTKAVSSSAVMDRNVSKTNLSSNSGKKDPPPPPPYSRSNGNKQFSFLIKTTSVFSLFYLFNGHVLPQYIEQSRIQKDFGPGVYLAIVSSSSSFFLLR